VWTDFVDIPSCCAGLTEVGQMAHGFNSSLSLCIEAGADVLTDTDVQRMRVFQKYGKLKQ
jgi:hypothetical protein